MSWKERIKSIDLLLAGPPCQGHSNLNNSTRRKDSRNGLYLRVVRAVEILRPAAVIIENVPAVLLDKGRVVDRAVRWFSEIGYNISEGVVHIAHLAVPQLRKRHILVAVSKGRLDLSDLNGFAQPAPAVGEYLAGLEDEPETRTGLFYQPARLTKDNQRRIRYLFRHDLYNLPNSMRPECHKSGQHRYLSMYGRIHWDKPAQTLTSGFGSMGQGRYVHPRRKRLLTPHEAARLQGFPDFFEFAPVKWKESLKTIIANAVPPQLVAVLVTRLIQLGVL
jgi:DNA (cytosine-5)-methyltransferase 1